MFDSRAETQKIEVSQEYLLVPKNKEMLKIRQHRQVRKQNKRKQIMA